MSCFIKLRLCVVIAGIRSPYEIAWRPSTHLTAIAYSVGSTVFGRKENNEYINLQRGLIKWAATACRLIYNVEDEALCTIIQILLLFSMVYITLLHIPFDGVKLKVKSICD